MPSFVSVMPPRGVATNAETSMTQALKEAVRRYLCLPDVPIQESRLCLTYVPDPFVSEPPALI
jgi:hypothetical protein